MPRLLPWHEPPRLSVKKIRKGGHPALLTHFEKLAIRVEVDGNFPRALIVPNALDIEHPHLHTACCRDWAYPELVDI